VRRGPATLRILHLTDTLAAGGAERNLLTVLQHTPDGIENHLAHIEGDALRRDFEDVATVQHIDVGSRFQRIRHTIGIRRLIEAIDPDVVHTQLLNSMERTSAASPLFVGLPCDWWTE
jgi:hypothetical protein